MNDESTAGNRASGTPDGFSRDPDYWYRRWVFACGLLDEEGAERLSAYAGMQEHLDEVAAAAGAAVREEIRAEERERVVAELQQEAATHLFTIRRTMRWAVWVVRGKPESDDPAGDYLVRPEAAGERPVCCPVETEAVRRAVAGRDSALARVRKFADGTLHEGSELQEALLAILDGGGND